MNHPAHFLLAAHAGEGTVGTLLADFHRGPISTALPDEIVASIALHRAIDGHTGSHPIRSERPVREQIVGIAAGNLR